MKLLPLLLLLPIPLVAQTLTPAAAYVSSTGLPGSWHPATATAGATPLAYVPTPYAIDCSSDGTGNPGTWGSCTALTAGSGTLSNAYPVASYISTTGNPGTWAPASGAAGVLTNAPALQAALYCNPSGTWVPCGFTVGTGTLNAPGTALALYCSNDGTGNVGTWVPCVAGAAPPTTIIATIFNEGTPPAVLTGTAPATDVPGSLWLVPSGAGACLFASGGGATCASTQNSILSVGATPPTNYTVTFSGLTNNNGMQYIVGQIENNVASGGTHRLAINTLGSTGVRLFDCLVNTGCNTITTISVASGATGSIVVKVAGTNITFTVFGAAPFNYNTATPPDPALGQYLGMFNFAATSPNIGGITVTTP